MEDVKNEMEWRIRESSHGGWVVEKGMKIKSVEVEYKPGCYMPGFMVYEMSRFDTRKQAETFVKKQTR